MPMTFFDNLKRKPVNLLPSFVLASLFALTALCPAFAQEAGNLYIGGTGSGANATQTTGPGTINAMLAPYSGRTGTQTPGRNRSRTAMIGNTPVYFNLSASNGWSGYSAAPPTAGDYSAVSNMSDTYASVAQHNEMVSEETAVAYAHGSYRTPNISGNNRYSNASSGGSNVFSGLQNVFSGGQNSYSGGQNSYSGGQNSFNSFPTGFPTGPAAITNGLNLAPRTMAGRSDSGWGTSGF